MNSKAKKQQIVDFVVRHWPKHKDLSGKQWAELLKAEGLLSPKTYWMDSPTLHAAIHKMKGGGNE